MVDITKILILSTAHIPPEVAAGLGEDFDGTDQEGIVPADVGDAAIYEMDGNGYMIWVPPDETFNGSNTHPVLRAIQEYAYKLGCAYVWLDPDGQTIDELPTWEW